MFVPALKAGLRQPVAPLLRLLLLPFMALLAARVLSYAALAQFPGTGLIWQLLIGGAAAFAGFAGLCCWVRRNGYGR